MKIVGRDIRVASIAPVAVPVFDAIGQGHILAPTEESAVKRHTPFLKIMVTMRGAQFPFYVIKLRYNPNLKMYFYDIYFLPSFY